MTVGPVGRNDSTDDFFDGTAAGEFRLRRCQPHGHLSRPQAHQCVACGSTDLEWTAASGRARLVSWAVVPARGREGEPPPPPNIPVIGELEEGPWWWSALVGVDPRALAEGLPLRIIYERADGGEAVPVFVLDSSQ
jgi:uncharacterized OB-fold protein